MDMGTINAPVILYYAVSAVCIILSCTTQIILPGSCIIVVVSRLLEVAGVLLTTIALGFYVQYRDWTFYGP